MKNSSQFFVATGLMLAASAVAGNLDVGSNEYEGACAVWLID